MKVLHLILGILAVPLVAVWLAAQTVWAVLGLAAGGLMWMGEALWEGLSGGRR